jgi:hypothetical protein
MTTYERADYRDGFWASVANSEAQLRDKVIFPLCSAAAPLGSLMHEDLRG